MAKNELDGLEKVLFSEELQALSDQAVLNNVVPGWINRVGYMDDPLFDIFNEKSHRSSESGSRKTVLL